MTTEELNREIPNIRTVDEEKSAHGKCPKCVKKSQYRTGGRRMKAIYIIQSTDPCGSMLYAFDNKKRAEEQITCMRKAQEMSHPENNREGYCLDEITLNEGREEAG